MEIGNQSYHSLFLLQVQEKDMPFSHSNLQGKGSPEAWNGRSLNKYTGSDEKWVLVIKLSVSAT